MTDLAATARALMADGKGLLAIDESPPTCNRRFAEFGIAQTPENRRAYRALIVTTPDLHRSISGVILNDETIHQRLSDGQTFFAALNDAGIIAGVKVDLGAKPLAGHDGETVTEGLDGLRDRLFDYAIRGARFAKWRAIFSIDGARPSQACIAVNASALGRFAALCQETGLVPIIEPEVLMDGGHGIARCADVTEMVLHRVFVEMAEQGVRLESLLLKPNMIVPGLSSTEACTPEDVAAETLTCLLCSVPAAVAGIVFLSGGQAAVQATQRLHAIVRKAGANAPWPIGFSFARAIQQPALQIWGRATGLRRFCASEPGTPGLEQSGRTAGDV